MKAVACLLGLCLLAGIVSADSAWETGKSYKYRVISRALAGITEIGNKYAGLQIVYDQICTPTEDGTVNVKFENLRVVEIDEALEQGWRQTPIKGGRQVQIDQQVESYLTSPMDMKVVNGVVEAIKVDGDLPTWAINIKRAQASVFTADTTGKNIVVPGNLKRQTGAGGSQEQESGYFFEVLEETVHGKCEVYYTVSQNGPFNFPYQFQKQAQAGEKTRGAGRQQEQSSEEQQGQWGQQQSSEEQQDQWGQQGQQRVSSSSSSEEQQAQQGQQRYQNGRSVYSSSSSGSEESQEGGWSVEKPWPQAYSQLCRQGDQIFEIIKTVNFTTCEKKPVAVFTSPSEINFHPGDNAGGSLWTRALVSRILTCGQSLRKFTILKITQQERFQTGLRDEDKVVAGTQKNVTLISIGSANPKSVRNPTTIEELTYQFDPTEVRNQLDGGEGQQQQQSSSEEQNASGSVSQEQGASAENAVPQSPSAKNNWNPDKKQLLPKPSMNEAPLINMLITPANRQELKGRFHQLMQEVIQDLVKPTESEQESIAQRETLSKVATLVKIIRALDLGDIEEVSRKWCQGGQQEGQQVFMESVAMAGTNPAINFVIKQIKSGQLHGERAASVLSTLPMYIRTPTRDLLRELYFLCDNETVKRHVQTRTSAILAFTNLAHQACVNKKIKNTRYPIALYGEFCQPNTVQEEFTDSFVKQLEKHLQQNGEEDKHWIFVLFKGLSNLGVPAVIPIVQKCLDEQSEPIIKVKAIYALQNLVQSHSNLNQQQGEQEPISADRQSNDMVTDKLVEKQVLPLLASVAFDSGEHPSVRAAAISLLVHCTYADVALWQQLAMSTWFERSLSIHSLVHSIIYSLAQLQTPLTGGQWHMQQKARKVVNLLKPIDASLARSHKIFAADFFHEINTGLSQQLQWIESKDAVIPNYIYYRNHFSFGNGAGGFAPLEVSLAGNTISKLITAVYKAIPGAGMHEQRHPELSQIHEILNIRARKQAYPVVGNLFLNVRNEMQRMWTIDEKTVEGLARQLIQKVMQGGQLQMPINYQKFAQLAEYVGSMPTALGFPITYRVRMSSLVSVRGQIQISNPTGPEFKAQADLAPVHAWKIHRQLAFKCPFTQKKYQSGVQHHFVAEFPFSAVARRAPRGHYQLAITPQHLTKGAPKGTIDMITYHQIPYTAIIHDEFWPTIYPKGGQLQVVRAPKEQQNQFSWTSNYGQKALGLHLKLQQESDFPVEQETASGWTRFLRRFHTPGSAFSAAWIGSPSIRYAQRKIVLNLEESQTKTLVLVVGRKFERVSVIEKLESSEENQSGSSSSSESQEGQEFFQGVRTPQNYRAAQQQNQQQMQSESSSESQEQQTQGNVGGRGKNWRQRNVIAVALLGKSAPLVSLKDVGVTGQQQQQSSSSSEEQGQQGSQPGSQSASQEQQQQGSTYQPGQQQEQGGLQRPLQKGSKNTIQYLLHLAQSPQGKLFVQFSLGEAANQAAESLPQTGTLEGVREAIIESPNSQSQPNGCVEFQGTLDTPKIASRHVIAHIRRTLLKNNLSVKVNAKLQAGKNCRAMPLFVTIQGKLQRDQEMTEWAESKSPKAQRCQADEKKGFSVSQVCMEVAREQAAALNEMDLTIKHSNLPVPLKNATAKLETLLKTAGYMYLSENQVPQSSPVENNQLKLWARMTPCKRFFSVHILQPKSILKFENIKTNKVIRAVLPPTATNTILGNIQRRVLRSQLHPTCQLEKNWVNTFDNVTYSFKRNTVQGCKTLLVKDCSGRYPMAVYANNIQDSQEQSVAILLGGATKIELIPVDVYETTSREQVPQPRVAYMQPRGYSEDYVTLINGKKVHLPYVVRGVAPRSSQPIVEIMEIPNGGVQVVGRHMKLAIDGRRIVVKVHQLLANRTCGVCGDFDKEKVAEMRSPQDVPLSSGSLLVASYSFALQGGAYKGGKGSSSGQCQIKPSLKSQVQKEEQLFLSSSRGQYVSKNQRRGPQYVLQQQQQGAQLQQLLQQYYQKPKPGYESQENLQQRSGSQSSSSESKEQLQSQEQQQSTEQGLSGKGLRFQQRAIRHPLNAQEICFTLEKVPICPTGTIPKKMVQQQTKVYCMKQGPKAQQIKEQLQEGQRRNFFSKPHHQIRIAVPEICLPVGQV